MAPWFLQRLLRNRQALSVTPAGLAQKAGLKEGMAYHMHQILYPPKFWYFKAFMTPLAVSRFQELLEEKHGDSVTEPPHNLTVDMRRFYIQPFVSR